MADAQLQITIKARNQAKDEFDKLDKQVKNLQGNTGVSGLNKTLGTLDSKFRGVTGVSLGFATAAGAAGMAVSGIVNFLKSAVDETVKYATEIDNMSRLIGLSTEETSRLVQASDDLFISQETLSTSLQAATRKGIDVSIEGLKKLADKYNSLPEGVERSKFALDTFGRSGVEMGKLLEVGAAGIDKATAAIANNLIVTEYSMQQIMNYKRSVDNLTDSWMGFKVQVGTSLIPQLDQFIRIMTRGTSETEEFYKAEDVLMNKISNLGWAAAVGSESAKARIAELEAELQALRSGFYDASDAAQVAENAINGLGNTVGQFYNRSNYGNINDTSNRGNYWYPTVPGKAAGGPVTASTPYVVGEVGPELFVPRTSGSIVPNNRLAGNTVINFHYSPAVSLSDRTEMETRIVPLLRKAMARV